MILLCGHEGDNGNGQRKRCKICNEKHLKEYHKQYSKKYHKKTYIYKRGPHEKRDRETERRTNSV